MLDQIKNIKDIKKLNDKQLEELASEIREYLIKNISITGGHLASNLGVVELTISLLKTFDFDSDKIIFDVGHQCYTYKILTGRKIDNIRKYKGISGFPKTSESKYDFFNTGHASDSISAALGMARARDIKKENYNIVTVIGDGSISGGMAFEALNDLGFRKSKMLIILNDNGMAISSNVGGLSNSLNNIRLNPFYNRLKSKTHKKLDRINDKKITNIIKRIKTSFKSLFFNPSYFDDLGIKYIGPVDGHNIKKLNKILEKIKKIDEPVLLHVKTVKGKGYEFAEKYPNIYHGIDSFDIKTLKEKGSNDTYSSTFGKCLCKLAKKKKDIVAITAAMEDGTGLSEFAKKYKDHFYDVGICEEHAVALAAGLAISKMKPYVSIYSTFLQRGFDQIIEDVCLQNLNVTFMIDRSGIVGEDGETHHGIFDTSFLSLIPNMTIMMPKCLADLEKILDFSYDFKGPLAIKYPKGKNSYPLNQIKKIEYGKWEVVSDGIDIAVVATGNMVSLAMDAKNKMNRNIMVINALFIKPLDDKLIKKLLKNNYKILVLEENVIYGGLGSMIKLKYDGIIKVVGINDKFVSQGKISELLKEEKLTVDRIIKNINEL